MARRKVIRYTRPAKKMPRRRSKAPSISRGIAVPIYPRTSVQSVVVRVRVQLSGDAKVQGLSVNIAHPTEPYTYLLYDTLADNVPVWTLSLGLMHRMAMSLVMKIDNTKVPPSNNHVALIENSQFRVNWVRFYSPLQETTGDLPYTNKLEFKTSELQPARVASFQPVLGKTTSLILRETSNFWHTQDKVANYGVRSSHWYDKSPTEIAKKNTTQLVGYLEYKVSYYYAPFSSITSATDTFLDITQSSNDTTKSILKGLSGLTM